MQLLILDFKNEIHLGCTTPVPYGSNKSNAYLIYCISSKEIPGLSNYCNLNDLLTLDALELEMF